jgi:1,4-dihydroxy-2-naphthoate octaprenyltransferase
MPPNTYGSVWRDNWKHLRLPFQMTLAPLFLWGAFLSGGALTWSLLPAFLGFHLLLYTGVTAYNSCCDQDEGPIGGLERPPTVHPSLLPVALALKASGLLLATWIGPVFTALTACFLVLSFLYSHPRTRWKAHPVLSALVVALGQGGIGFLAGWAAARGNLDAVWCARGAAGAASAALTTLGMYPISQVYQVEEDRRRGDRTLCVTLGADGGLRFSQGCFVAAGAAATWLAAREFGWLDASILGAAYLFLLSWVARFRREFASLSRREAFRRVLFLSYAGPAGFLLFILMQTARGR